MWSLWRFMVCEVLGECHVTDCELCETVSSTVRCVALLSFHSSYIACFAALTRSSRLPIVVHFGDFGKLYTFVEGVLENCLDNENCTLWTVGSHNRTLSG